MWRSKPQIRKRKRVDFAVVVEFLIGLEALQSVHRVISPLPVYLAFEIAAVGERLLDLLVALWVRMKLISRARSGALIASVYLTACGARFRG